MERAEDAENAECRMLSAEIPDSVLPCIHHSASIIPPPSPTLSYGKDGAPTPSTEKYSKQAPSAPRYFFRCCVADLLN